MQIDRNVYRSAQHMFRVSILDPVREISIHDSFKALTKLKAFSTADVTKSRSTIWYLWAHECVRSFCDSCRVHNLGKPQSIKAINAINEQVNRALKAEVKKPIPAREVLFTHLQAGSASEQQARKGARADLSSSYTMFDRKGQIDLKKSLMRQLRDRNSLAKSPINVYITPSVMRDVCRISRAMNVSVQLCISNDRASSSPVLSKPLKPPPTDEKRTSGPLRPTGNRTRIIRSPRRALQREQAVLVRL